jgi:hypothetical protein
MSSQQKDEPLKLWTPAKYQIHVQGYLDNSWSDQFWGMRILKNNRVGQVPVTTLVGQLRDQAALIGVLNSLYELHLPILSVVHLEE